VFVKKNKTFFTDGEKNKTFLNDQEEKKNSFIFPSPPNGRTKGKTCGVVSYMQQPDKAYLFLVRNRSLLHNMVPTKGN
jgi:hypothetical protein